MSVIDIGPACINRASDFSGNNTYIQTDNPANAAGTITSVEIYVNANMFGVKVAIFSEGATGYFTAQDSESIGNLVAGKQTVEVSLSVNEGEFIGLYFGNGKIERTLGAVLSGYYLSGDETACSNKKFNAYTSVLSIYGTGTTPNIAPTAPTSLCCEGETDPTSVTDLTPELDAILNDPDSGDYLDAVEIHVGTTNDPENSPNKWDSGTITLDPDIEEGNRCSSIPYAGSAISQLGETFYWCIRARDDDGEWGPFSAAAQFTMAPKEVGVSDTGSGMEAVSAQVALTVAETGTGADAIATLLGRIAIAETGSGADAVSAINAFISAVDAGSGSESLVAVVTVSIAETGSGADTVSHYRLLLEQDNASGADIVAAVRALLSIADVAAGNDVSTIKATISIADTAEGADVVSLRAQLVIADTATGVDAFAAQATISIADTATGVDAFHAIQALLAITDVAVGTDALAGVQVRVGIADTAEGADVVQPPRVELTISDSGEGSEITTVTVRMTLIDTGAGDESLSVTARVQLLDSGVGVDAIAELLSAVTIADAGVAGEILEILVGLGIADAGAGTDLLSLVQSAIAIADAGTGADAVTTKEWSPTVSIEIEYAKGITDVAYDEGDSEATYKLNE